MSISPKLSITVYSRGFPDTLTLSSILEVVARGVSPLLPYLPGGGLTLHLEHTNDTVVVTAEVGLEESEDYQEQEL